MPSRQHRALALSTCLFAVVVLLLPGCRKTPSARVSTPKQDHMKLTNQSTSQLRENETSNRNRRNAFFQLWSKYSSQELDPKNLPQLAWYVELARYISNTDPLQFTLQPSLANPVYVNVTRVDYPNRSLIQVRKESATRIHIQYNASARFVRASDIHDLMMVYGHSFHSANFMPALRHHGLESDVATFPSNSPTSVLTALSKITERAIDQQNENVQRIICESLPELWPWTDAHNLSINQVIDAKHRDRVADYQSVFDGIKRKCDKAGVEFWVRRTSTNGFIVLFRPEEYDSDTKATVKGLDFSWATFRLLLRRALEGNLHYRFFSIVVSAEKPMESGAHIGFQEYLQVLKRASSDKPKSDYMSKRYPRAHVHFRVYLYKRHVEGKEKEFQSQMTVRDSAKHHIGESSHTSFFLDRSQK